ncbi:MAG: ATP-binding protein [Chloroflexota bacterium]|nr:ATP-binding protein [Chloroflexota bacterium]
MKFAEVPPAVGRLIRAVGHDLRNKLGVMKNSIYYLNMKLGHGDEKVQKHLKIMEREIGNANRITANLMDFALTKEPGLRKTDLKAVVAEALSQVSLPDRWEAHVHLEDELPPLMADVNQLQRAFTNIILRIIQGAPEGNKLLIAAREEGGFVEIEFGAAGFTIPEEDLTKIFDPLASAGLGMAVSKRLVENHGGTIQVRSLAGEGADFTVRLPISGSEGLPLMA